MLNNKGPRMEPCGTPVRVASHSLKVLHIYINSLFADFQVASHKL